MLSVRHFRFRGACLAGVFAVLLPGVSTYAASANADAEMMAAFEAARKAVQPGPVDVKLGEQAVLKLQEGFVYLPPKESAQLMLAMGNRTGEGLLGTVFPDGKQEGWFVVINFDAEGYIKDDDAKDWNAGELLQSLKDGTEQANSERAARGIPAIEVVGWVEPPRYDASTHQLVWSVSSREKGQSDSAGQGINYNTYALGREGYISMNLVTGLDAIEQDKRAAHALLSWLSFNEGKRYADFNESTDKVAAYGLAALVGGIAAKKLGLLAALAVFLVKFWKIIAIAVVAGGAVFARLLKQRKSQHTKQG